MLENIFKGIFDSTSESVISVGNFLLCIGVSLLIGIFLAFLYGLKSRSTKSFLITLALLPAAVCVVIMMVNGNVGAGVAVAGAFGLVRFRSMPGSAKEITAIFIAMSAGLISGMGYLAYAVLFAVVLGGAFFAANVFMSNKKRAASCERTLKITVPEDLDYASLFDEVLGKYTENFELSSVKTTNMGSLFKLTYNITEKDLKKEKDMIDELRIRNGNLEIAVLDREVKDEL